MSAILFLVWQGVASALLLLFGVVALCGVSAAENLRCNIGGAIAFSVIIAGLGGYGLISLITTLTLMYE